MQSNSWSGVLVGVQQSTFQKIDWLTNGLHSKIIFGFGLWIALQNIGVLKYPAYYFTMFGKYCALCWVEVSEIAVLCAFPALVGKMAASSSVRL